MRRMNGPGSEQKRGGGAQRLGHQRGVTLLEVMMALLVFSLGLLGLGAMLIVSVQTNRNAFLLTQASFLAQSMADRMHGNLARVWTGDYAATYPTSDSDPCTSGATCSRAAVAMRDRALWSRQLVDSLPHSSAQLSCVNNTGVAIIEADQANGAPYPGLCTITISWSGQSLEHVAVSEAATTTSSATVETFAWNFQP